MSKKTDENERLQLFEDVVDVETDTGILVTAFNRLEKPQRDRILGYVEAFADLKDSSDG